MVRQRRRQSVRKAVNFSKHNSQNPMKKYLLPCILKANGLERKFTLQRMANKLL